MRSYKVELVPNNRQRTACLQHAGAGRWAYNYGLARKIEARKAGLKAPTAVDLHRELVVLKHSTVPWLANVSKCAPQQALRNLDTAYRNFFRRCKSGVKKKGFPKFKSRKRGIGAFYLEGSIKVTNRTIKFPRIGELRLKERGYIPPGVVIKSAVISERAGHWFVAVRTDEEASPHSPGSEVLGVDVGIKSLAVLSDGTVFENPKALKAAERRLRQIQKAVSRKQKGSGNRRKAVAKLARQHYRVACVRSDAIHKATTSIIKRSSLVGIESLNIAGMMKNHHVARSLSDASLSELHRQIEYKAEWAGITVVKADRFFASSKTCSDCGLVKEELKLSERTFKCKCGFDAERDLNAAINLKNLAVSSTVVACCPGGAGRSHALVKPPVGQEPNAIQDGVLKWVSFGERKDIIPLIRPDPRRRTP